jgi:Wiskott-Aldrich syndrome protein
MGFTDNAYPELPGKIKAQMPPSGVVSKDTEDDIVTTLLEELLAMSPRPHSGSNAKDKSIPGAWH